MALLQNKLVLIILGSAVAALVGWYVFLRDTTPEPLLTTTDLTVRSDADKEVVETLLALRSITLSGTIFSDEAFLALTDSGTAIVDEPVGRPNPFAPLEGTVGAPGTTGTTTRAPAVTR
jgi:hypothetical protein